MKGLRPKIDAASSFIREHGDIYPQIGIVLGSGLGGLSDHLTSKREIPYEQIPHFPASTVEGHAGRLLLGRLGGKAVVLMDGRFHYYEGYSPMELTLPIRVMKALGVTTLVVTNAAGALNPKFSVGDIVMITDHINMQFDNPLRGINDNELGPRFPDMYKCYDEDLRALALKAAIDGKIYLRQGVYVAVSGPMLETGAEYRSLRSIGADLVGMSSVPEVIVARHQGTKVLGFSIVTNAGHEAKGEEFSHQNVLAVASKSGSILAELIKRIFECL